MNTNIILLFGYIFLYISTFNQEKSKMIFYVSAMLSNMSFFFYFLFIFLETDNLLDFAVVICSVGLSILTLYNFKLYLTKNKG